MRLQVGGGAALTGQRNSHHSIIEMKESRADGRSGQRGSEGVALTRFDACARQSVHRYCTPPCWG